MSERTKGWIMEGLINLGIFVIALGVYFAGGWSMRSAYRQKAIEANVAEWVMTDPKAGDVEFRWKTNTVREVVNYTNVVVQWMGPKAEPIPMPQWTPVPQYNPSNWTDKLQGGLLYYNKNADIMPN